MPKRLTLLLIAVLLWGGCARQQEELILSTNNWLGYLPLYLARDAGYYDDIPLRLVQLPSNTETMRAFRNGMVAAAGLTLDETLLLLESGLPICVPLVMDYSSGADALISRAGISSLEQLRGKRIGVESTAVGAHMLNRALERAGLQLGDVSVVPLEVHEHLPAFESGRIDALVTFSPTRGQLLAAGANELFSSADIPGEIVDLLVVRRDYLEKNPQVVAKLLDGWFRVLSRLNEDGQLEALARYSGLSPEGVREALALIEFPDSVQSPEVLRRQRESFRQMAERMNTTMQRQGLIASRLEVEQLFCPVKWAAEGAR